MSSSPEDTIKKEKKGLSTKALVLIILIVILLCGTAIAIVLLLRENETQPAPINNGIPVTAENVREIDRQIDEQVERGMFETYYSPTWTFPDGSSPASNFLMGNSPANRYPFYFTLALTGAEDDLIYTSDVLPVGMQLGELVLDRDLDAGTYSAAISVHMVDDEGVEIQSNMGFIITLIIEN